jgi:predicted transcriptional regulator
VSVVATTYGPERTAKLCDVEGLVDENLVGPLPEAAAMIASLIAGHGHLWLLRDGTPAHAPPGILTHNGDGQIACHLCGRWYTHLGLHLRRHSWTADQYRDAVGLALHVPLCSARISERIGARQKYAWDHDPAMRARLDIGQRMAASGDLSRFSVEAARERQTNGRVPSGTQVAQRVALNAGRATTSRLREERLARLIADSGESDLSGFLTAAYTNGASLDSLAKTTGLGRQRLREALIAAEVTSRPSGRNLIENKQRRARVIDARVAERVGSTDIRLWLAEQREFGSSLAALARQTGRSIPWVTSRLQGITTTRSRAAADAGSSRRHL